MSTRTLAELAAELGGTVVGDGSTVIRGVAGIREAQAGDITFIANATAATCRRPPRRRARLAQARAAAGVDSPCW